MKQYKEPETVVDKQQYGELAKKMSPPSPLLWDCLKAFVIGGLICVVGQLVSIFGKDILSLDKDMDSAFVAIVMVFLGATLTGIGIYDDLGKFAGAGSIVPITGFANSIVSCAVEFNDEGLIMGTSAKMFQIAGPVLVYGFCASVLVGLIYYLMGVFA